MRTPHAPRAVSGPKSVSIEGCLLAFDRHAEQWVLLGMEGSDVLHLPVFSSDEKLFKFLGRVLEASAVIETKIIGDEDGFLASPSPPVADVAGPGGSRFSPRSASCLIRISRTRAKFVTPKYCRACQLGTRNGRGN